MNQISPKESNISTLLIGLLFFILGTSPFASMSVYHKGHPKIYVMSKEEKGQWSVKALKQEGELNILKAQILLEGADFKGGTFSLSSKKFAKAELTITDAFLGKGGIFNCEGILKMNDKKKELFFDVNLNPIKKGFTFNSQIKFAQEDFGLKLFKKNKKSHDDIVFKVDIRLLEK